MSKSDCSDQDSNGEAVRHKARDDQPTDEDVYKAIRNLKDKKGSTVKEIGKYLTNEFDKFKNASSKQLTSFVKKAACKGMENGRLTKSRDRFLLTGNPSDAASPDQNQGSSSKRNRRRSRRRRFKCPIRRSYRPYCSKYKRRCCKRKRKCRASVRRSKRPVCSRYKPKCCRRR